MKNLLTKARPILFTAPMVRAILDGQKTQTRRVVKPQPDVVAKDGRAAMWTTHRFVEEKRVVERDRDEKGNRYVKILTCPYGLPGDHLWVKETFQPLLADGFQHGDSRLDYLTGEGYRASYSATAGRIEFEDDEGNLNDKLTPSIYMPRWASRITLEVTGIRVERLQEISEEDAREEGAREIDVATGREVLFAPASQRGSYVRHYRHIWEQINGANSWDKNPWVWVVEFRRIAA